MNKLFLVFCSAFFSCTLMAATLPPPEADFPKGWQLVKKNDCTPAPNLLISDETYLKEVDPENIEVVIVRKKNDVPILYLHTKGNIASGPEGISTSLLHNGELRVFYTADTLDEETKKIMQESVEAGMGISLKEFTAQCSK